MSPIIYISHVGETRIDKPSLIAIRLWYRNWWGVDDVILVESTSHQFGSTLVENLTELELVNTLVRQDYAQDDSNGQ